MFRLTRIALFGLLLTLFLAPLTGFSATRPGTATAVDTSLLRFANKLHAITLTTSNIAPSAEDMRVAYPELIVYLTHEKSAGSRLYYLRIGFFADKNEARATLATVRSWYPDAFVTQITQLEQFTALGVDLDTLAQKAARQAPRKQTPAAPQPPATPPAGYALRLDVAANPQFTPTKLPSGLKGYHLYVQRLSGAKGVEFHLNLGVFADRKSAEQARDKMFAQYPQAALREITALEQNQVTALPAQPVPAVSTKPAVPNVAVKPSAPVVATKTAPIVATKPIEHEVASKPVVPDVVVKPAAPVEAEKPALSVAAKPALPEVAAQPATPAVIAKPAASGGGDTERQAQVLLDNAQDQIIARQFDAAVKTLGEILSLPKNNHTADAMEYTGLAYDQAGKAKQAIEQYQKFLRLYPDSRSAHRVRQRLQTLQKG